MKGWLERFGIVLSSVVLTLVIVVLSEIVTISYSTLTGMAVSKTALVLAALVPVILCPPVYYIILSILKKLNDSEVERGQVIEKLEAALADVKMLSGLLPICAHCKKVRDDEGYWKQIEDYIFEHSEMRFSHGVCPSCVVEFYPELDE